MTSYTYYNDSEVYFKPKGQGDLVREITYLSDCTYETVNHELKWHVTTYVWNTYQSPSPLFRNVSIISSRALLSYDMEMWGLLWSYNNYDIEQTFHTLSIIFPTYKVWSVFHFISFWNESNHIIRLLHEVDVICSQDTTGLSRTYSLWFWNSKLLNNKSMVSSGRERSLGKHLSFQVVHRIKGSNVAKT